MAEAYFSRQVVLQGFGPQAQRRLAASTALVVGLGGTGCVVATNLALAGVGRLILLDRDIVSIDNLHRQPIYSLRDVGKSKAEAAAKFIKARVHDQVVDYRAENLDDQNAEEFLEDATVAVDCLDNIESRLALNHACAKKSTPMVHTGAIGWGGSVGLFWSPRTACLECLVTRGGPLLPDCAVVGVLGASTSVIGSLAVLETISWLTKHDSSLLGRLLVYDFETLTSYVVDVQKRKSCEACGSVRPRFARRGTIRLCGGGEFYMPHAYASADYEEVISRTPTGALTTRKGSSVTLVKFRDGSSLALFRTGGVLVRGVSTVHDVERMLGWLASQV